MDERTIIYLDDAIDAAKRVLGDHEITRTMQTALYILPSAQPEPCKDTISRQAVIDELTRFITPHDNGDGTMTVGVLSKSSIIDILNDLPSAQPIDKDMNVFCTDTISRQAANSKICNACGMIDCDQMDKCEKLFTAQNEMCDAQEHEKYIDTDLISRKTLIHELNNSHYPGAPYVDAGISIAIGKVCNAPNVKSEIVRCKDCKHWMQQTNYQGVLLSFGFCESDDMWRSLYGETYEVDHIDTDEDFYCGYAERKTNE